MKKTNWLFLFTSFQIITIAIVFISVATQSYKLPLQIISIITCLVSYLCLFMLYRNIVQKAKLEADNEILKKQIALQKEHYITLQENQKQLLKIKEDLLEKMNVAHPEAFEDEESTRAYINDLISKSEQIQELEYCRNKVLDAILYNKVLLAKSYQTPMHIHLLIPEKLSIDPLDIMKLFSNLIDNAIEACTHVEEDKRYIELRGGIRSNVLAFTLTNAKLPEQTVDLKHTDSTKQDKENHGLGLQIIQEVIEKYRGYISYDDQGDVVTCSITLTNQSDIQR